MLEKPARHARRDINLIPLINIIFLLLTFFLVAGTIEKVDPFPLDVPDASKRGDTKSQQVSVIYMHKGGLIAINNDVVTKQDFATIVGTLALENKGRELLIKADSDVPASELIWAMRAIEGAGGGDISIVTKVAK
jgi:biopolymer transport protein ExbD